MNKPAWDPQGLIPLLFDRIERSVPNQTFLYNTVIDLMHYISVPENGGAFIKQKAKHLLKEVYLSRMELPRVY